MFIMWIWSQQVDSRLNTFAEHHFTQPFSFHKTEKPHPLSKSNIYKNDQFVFQLHPDTEVIVVRAPSSAHALKGKNKTQYIFLTNRPVRGAWALVINPAWCIQVSPEGNLKLRARFRKTAVDYFAAQVRLREQIHISWSALPCGKANTSERTPKLSAFENKTHLNIAHCRKQHDYGVCLD